MASSCGAVVSLKDLCLLTVSSYLCPSTFWSIYRLEPNVHCPRLKRIVHSFICDNFMDISHSDEFLDLGKKAIKSLLDNQDIKVSEAAMLDSLARWYKHKERQRENAFKQLFEKIHLSVIGKIVLSEVIKKYQLEKVIPKLRNYKKPSRRNVNLDDLIFQENISNIALLGQVFPFDILPNPDEDRLQCWMPLACKLVDSECPVLTFLDSLEHCFYTKKIVQQIVPYGISEMYVLGLGLRVTFTVENDLNRTMSFNLRYNMISRTFDVCTPFCDSESLFYYISVACGHFIFLIKGVSGWTRGRPDDPADDPVATTYNVHRYDTDKDLWQEVRPAIMAHSSETDSAVPFKNRYVYIFGVHGSEMYDLATNSWTPVETPWQGREENMQLHRAATLGDQIYVWLKITNHLIFAYNPATKNWQSHGEQIYPSITEAYFGEIFSLYFIKGRRKLVIMNDNMVEERVFPIKKFFSSTMDFFHMFVLSRGARIAIEQDKTVQQPKK